MRIFLFFCFFFSPFLWREGGGEAVAQCCSANPVAGTINVGVLNKKSARVISYYRHSYSDTYFHDNMRSDLNLITANYNYIGSIVSYGITSKVTAETELGYFINKSEEFNIEPPFTLKGLGFNNAIISLKYPIYKKTELEIEFTAAAGIKFPFTKEHRVIDGVRLPQAVQSSTGAYGTVGQLMFYKGYVSKGLGFFFIHRFETNGTNTVEYKFGNSYITSFFVSKSLNNQWAGILQIRNENRARDIRDNKIVEVSGGYLLFVATQINYTIAQKWNISLLADIPVYRYYNGTQLGNKYAFAVTLMKDFDFSSKKII